MLGRLQPCVRGGVGARGPRGGGAVPLGGAELSACLGFSSNERVWAALGGDVCHVAALGELLVCWEVSTWPPRRPTSSIAVGAVRLSCSGRGGLRRALGAGGRVCSPGPPVLLASQPGHPFRAGVWMACLGRTQDAGAITLAWSLSSWVAQGAMRVRREPGLPRSFLPRSSFFTHFLVQTDVNLNLEKGGRAVDGVTAPAALAARNPARTGLKVPA